MLNLILIVGGAIYLLYEYGASTILITVSSIVIAVFIYIAISTHYEGIKRSERFEDKRIKRKSLMNKQKKIYARIIEKHIQELSIKKQQLVVKGSYGQINSEKWDKEKIKFITEIISPHIKTETSMDLLPLQETLSSEIDAAVDDNDINSSIAYREDMDPYEYEHFCAKILNDNGWSAQATVASGDQGADVIAEKNNKKVIIQCKKWSNPVGNKSVQEVFTATSFHKAHKGVVVSNNAYTPSAKEAANMVGVLLIHHSELPQLEAII